MDIYEAIKFAISYLWSNKSLGVDNVGKEEDYSLNRELQYLLCDSFNRLARTWGECNISEKDIHMLVESWIMAQGTGPGHKEALVLTSTPNQIIT